MLTKFKLFEKLNDKKRFWLLDLDIKSDDDTYRLASLMKIGCTDDEIEFMLNLFDGMEEMIYINLNSGVNSGVDEAGYMPGDKIGYDWYKDNGYEYMGEIIPTEEDIERAEIKLDADKYNL
jgi:hypothetical protein